MNAADYIRAFCSYGYESGTRCVRQFAESSYHGSCRLLSRAVSAVAETRLPPIIGAISTTIVAQRVIFWSRPLTLNEAPKRWACIAACGLVGALAANQAVHWVNQALL